MSDDTPSGQESGDEASMLTHWKDTLQILQSAVTIAAILVGGVWTYNKFIKEREDYPQLNVAHHVESRQISQEQTWIQVAVSITNSGKRRVKLGSAYVRLQEIFPLAATIVTAITKKKDPVDETAKIVLWDTICQKSKDLHFELEPNEEEPVIFEFIIPRHIKTIKIYSFIGNPRKQQSGSAPGWKTTTIYDVPRNKLNGGQDEISALGDADTRYDNICRSDK